MRKFAELCKYLGVKPAKEIALYFLILALIGGVAVGLYFYRGLNFILVFPAVLALAFTVYYIVRYPLAKLKIEDNLVDEFVKLFTFFGIYIRDGFNVYNALEEIRKYASERFLAMLEQLLEDIEKDKSVAPFVGFGRKFNSLQIKEVMVSVYQMVDEGSGDAYINQFKHLFGKLSDYRHEAETSRKLNRLENLAFLPLAGSGIAMLVLTMGIMEVMGGVMSGL